MLVSSDEYHALSMWVSIRFMRFPHGFHRFYLHRLTLYQSGDMPRSRVRRRYLIWRVNDHQTGRCDKYITTVACVMCLA
jgi:hypothetical protein